MESKTKITIVDSIMGSGKTTYAISKMKDDDRNNYIYITPYLSEVQRIKEHCKDRKFTEPKNIGEGKLGSLHNLLINNRNIASTHALFQMSTEDTKDLIQYNEYVLILDEVMNVIEQIPLKKNDMEVLTSLELIHVAEDGMVSWNEDKQDFDSKYNDIKTMCKSNSLFMVNNCLLMWTFPIDIFNAFKEVYILTYLFKGQIQRYYYDMYNVDYEYKSVGLVDGSYELIDYVTVDDLSLIKDKINILDDDKMNGIGDYEFALSKSWYDKATPDKLNKLKKNNENYFRNKLNSKSNDNMWTTFKDYRSRVSGKGYTKGFVSVGARATNEFMRKINLSYNVNNFLNPIVKQFFNTHGVNVDEDTYALSELIQWVWRSRIRNDELINVYVPSKRMRDLLISWLN